jgi:hypothetical protein
VTDFGTSHLLSQLSSSHVVQRGTLPYSSPELLRAGACASDAAPDLDYRSVDAYAYGILLCELWSDGRSPFRDMPRPYREEVMDLLAAVANDGWRPAVPEGMPAAYASVMQLCWRAAPAERCGFDAVCNLFAALPPPPAAAAAAATPTAAATPPHSPLGCTWSAASTMSGISSSSSHGGGAQQQALARRTSMTSLSPFLLQPPPRCTARLRLRYTPSLPRGAACELWLRFTVDDSEGGGGSSAAAAAEEFGRASSVATDGALDEHGCVCLQFVFHVARGDAVTLQLAPAEGCEPWLGGGACELAAGAAGETLLTWAPAWHAAPAALPPSGVPAALSVAVERTSAAAAAAAAAFATGSGTPRRRALPPIVSRRMLGSLSLLLAPAGLRRTLSRLPSLLAPRGRADIMLSYRDRETGLFSNNGYAFHLQAALEALGFTVFCYATSVRAGAAWVNVLSHGIQACDAFVCLCSPTYGDFDISPWTSNELVQAARAFRATGRPAIVPLWHHGEYPPAHSGALLGAITPVPADYPAELLPVEAVLPELLAALKAVGVVPPKAGADEGRDVDMAPAEERQRGGAW